ncbi:uncharacterized protein PG986_000511 [Apiospora aurea]|uniref:Uncharacterized protein n=1 Tax=Apiospora aurea TaxID=335848 RepID=A0ABR1QUA7_9PEZI
MSSYHTVRTRSTNSQSTNHGVPNHSPSTSGAHAPPLVDRDGRPLPRRISVDQDGRLRRHSTVPGRRPPPTQRIYVPYRPPPTVVEPQPQRPVEPPDWVSDYNRYSVAGEQESYYATFERHESGTAYDAQSNYDHTYGRQSTRPSRASTPQPGRPQTAPEPPSFQEPAPQAARRPSFWTRLLCGSQDGGSTSRSIGADETRAARPVGPSASTRRRARHAGDEDDPYRVVVGYDADTGHTYYGPRYGG